MEGQPGEVCGLRIDEVVCPEAALDHLDRAHATLQLAYYEGENHVAAEADSVLHKRAERAEIGGVTRLHVGDADPVDEILVVDPAPWIDRPALGGGIGVQVAVEKERRSAARALEATDGVEAALSTSCRSVESPNPFMLSTMNRASSLSPGVPL